MFSVSEMKSGKNSYTLCVCVCAWVYFYVKWCESKWNEWSECECILPSRFRMLITNAWHDSYDYIYMINGYKSLNQNPALVLSLKHFFSSNESFNEWMNEWMNHPQLILSCHRIIKKGTSDVYLRTRSFHRYSNNIRVAMQLEHVKNPPNLKWCSIIFARCVIRVNETEFPFHWCGGCLLKWGRRFYLKLQMKLAQYLQMLMALFIRIYGHKIYICSSECIRQTKQLSALTDYECTTNSKHPFLVQHFDKAEKCMQHD